MSGLRDICNTCQSMGYWESQGGYCDDCAPKSVRPTYTELRRLRAEAQAGRRLREAVREASHYLHQRRECSAGIAQHDLKNEADFDAVAARTGTGVL